MHKNRIRRSGEPGIADSLKREYGTGSDWFIDAQGYVRRELPLNGGRRTKHEMEHRVVMAETLGRALAPGENVHHLNGVKHDNRPENLELWITSQPSGQRRADLVAWAHEILARYEVAE